MTKEIRESILRTIIYSDIFDYPLTSVEIWKFLISSKKINKKEFLKNFNKIPDLISKKGKFYFLKNRKDIIKKRIEREKESDNKLRIAKKVISYLSKIPTILLIGISGTVAMKNAEKEEDIDLFIITKKNSVWITRFFILFILEILGRRRKREDINVINKICVNMLIDKSMISFKKDRQDLYTAHEIVQMNPVFDKNKTYQEFIISNIWVNKFLPNSTKINMLSYKETKKEERNIFNKLAYRNLNLFFKKLQISYMKKHKTSEILLDNFITFHPVDAKNKVLSLYNVRIKKYAKI
ncbi:MAG: hypothetical protein M1524_02685 [Patescibacteria group bacterium]|nr:hypothetical protein [Patescibacteria group bacterium]